MDLSVIIVNYNTYTYTKACIASVLKAVDYARGRITAEVIVVDNASPDRSGKRLAEDFRDDGRVRFLFSHSNDGYAAANNRALAEADGAYLLLLNSDTVVGCESLEKTVEYMRANPDIGALGCRVLLADGTLDAACKRSFPTPQSALYHFTGLDRLFASSPRFGAYNLTHLDENATADVDCVMGAYMCVPCAVYEATGGFDTDYFMYGEDIDWCYRIKKAGWRVVYYADTSIIHYKKASWDGRKNPKVLDAFYDSMLIFYDKHYKDQYPAVVNTAVKTGTGLLKRLAHLKNALK